MAVNPVGYVPLFDWGTPKLISALNPVGVTGGQVVFFAGGSDVVSSGADTFASSDIVISGLASGASFNGVVVTPGNTASGTNSYVSVALDGAIILPCAGDVFGGKQIEIEGGDAVQRLGSQNVPGGADDAGTAGFKAGRALTSGFSGTTQFAVIQLNP